MNTPQTDTPETDAPISNEVDPFLCMRSRARTLERRAIAAEAGVKELTGKIVRIRRVLDDDALLQDLKEARAALRLPDAARKIVGQHGPKGSPNLYGPSMPDPYAELKAAHADGKVIQVNMGKWVNPEAEDMWEDREEPAWDIYPEFYRIKPEPAQVPLGPEDIKPNAWLDIHGEGEIVKVKSWGKLGVINDCRDERRRIFSYDELFKMGSKINTSIPDTGRWDKDAWRDCSKLGK